MGGESEAPSFELMIADLAGWFLDNRDTTRSRDMNQTASVVVRSDYRY